MKYLFIDIRKSDEVYSNRFELSNEYKFYNIPMNMIRFNQQMIIKHLKYVDEIYIVCKSFENSQFIKNKYFKYIDRIKVNKNLQFSKLKYGHNNISINNNNININIIGSNSFNMYNVMRITQLIMGSIMLLSSIIIYLQLKKIDLLNKINMFTLIVLFLFGTMAIINGLTSTCSISSIYRNYLN